MARKASNLYVHAALASWLYTRVRGMAANFRRIETRWKGRQQHTRPVNGVPRSELDPSPWPEIGLVLDDALHQLREKDRAAVVLGLCCTAAVADNATVPGAVTTPHPTILNLAGVSA